MDAVFAWLDFRGLIVYVKSQGYGLGMGLCHMGMGVRGVIVEWGTRNQVARNVCLGLWSLFVSRVLLLGMALVFARKGSRALDAGIVCLGFAVHLVCR